MNDSLQITEVRSAVVVTGNCPNCQEEITVTITAPMNFADGGTNYNFEKFPMWQCKETCEKCGEDFTINKRSLHAD